MARKLKVYGWRGWRSECPPAPNGNRQTREVVATTSKTKARKLSGDLPVPLSEISETGNDEEIAQALSEPEVVFWHPLDEHFADRKWRSIPAAHEDRCEECSTTAVLTNCSECMRDVCDECFEQIPMCNRCTADAD